MHSVKYRYENFIYDYINELLEQKNNLIVFISAKDTPGTIINSSLNAQLQLLGLKSDFTRLHWHGYCAIINQGKLVEEKDCYDRSVECNGQINDISYFVFSGPLHCENKSIITINGLDYSTNLRGLNFVIYDLERSCVTDSVSFDTFFPNIPASRTMTANEFKINNQIVELTNKVNDLAKEVKKSDIFNKQMLWQLFRKQNESITDAQKRFFRTFEDNDETLHLVHLCLVKILAGFDRICQKNNLQYWIDYGALLGAYRHGKCIPWDDDLDVGMMRSDIYKLNDLLKGNRDYKLEFKQAYLDGYIRFVRFMTTDVNNPCFIDIFFNDYCDDNADIVWQRHCAIRRETVELSANIRKQVQGLSNEQLTEKVFDFLDKQVVKEQKQINSTGKGKNIFWACDNFSFWTKNVFEPNDLFPLLRVTIDGVECNAPNKIEKRLEILYGDFYSLPNDIGRKHINIGETQIQAIKDFLGKE